ncbi:reverse transcriptase N-terminal domain-containing protein [Phormidium pseudopriestleyi FRX01]|uniref:Reverse transcriptase N-terminal domain-containing protein n=1 Tax=Phormidium pseudopriestleyi FRX01 TaxID=1759528 RepID=A0ABS3FUT6_9CYAN|nr:reverse transcriptase N-terminal domain-containing protein [Phormidium pseudopriestleyi FRX01]
MSKTSQLTRVEWNKLNWRKLERVVFKLQKRIFRAAQRGDTKAVRKLQKTLLRSWSARCLVARQEILSGNQLGRTGLTPKISEVKSNPDKAKNRCFRDVKFRPNKRQGIDNASGVKNGDRCLNSAEQIRTCTQSLSLLLKANKTAKLEDLIPKINKTIQDWSNQNQPQCNRKLIKRIHHDLHQMIMQWGRRRTGSYQRAYHLYWQRIDGRVKLV